VFILSRVERRAADALDVPPQRHDESKFVDTSPLKTTHQSQHRGFTFIEVIVVVAILGIISLVVVFSVGGATDRSEVAACGAEARTLIESADAYMTGEQVDVLPAMGSSANRYELALIDAGHLDQVSTKYDLHEDGTVNANGRSCSSAGVR
jgi:prepilin-type N-terminal cleavage/methylation domain-containing protein